MSIVRDDTDRWLVSARTDGEVLTTEASVPGLELRLIGGVEGYLPEELASWLQSLARAVRDSVPDPPPGDPVPPMLREALGGLLFSRAELWGRGPSPCALAMVAGQDRIGFGWVGEASVEVFRDGYRDDSEWISIRDAQGREARAWCGSPQHGVRVELVCASGSDATEVRIEAQWPVGAHDPPVEWSAASDPAGLAAASSPWRDPEHPPSAPTESERLHGLAGAPSSGVARWLAQHLQWSPATSGPAPAPPPEREHSVEDLVGALAAEISSHMDPSAPTSDPELPSPEIETGPLDVPDRIPPTPEPAALTARAVDPVGARPTPEPPTATATPAAETRRVPPRHPEWPDLLAQEADAESSPWRPALLWGAVVLVLFGIGWIVGSFQGQAGPEAVRRPSSLVLFLRRFGLAPPRFELAVTSRPGGAWIAVDGKDLSVKAPVTLQLAPGEHRVELSFPDLGSASYRVRGSKNDRLALDVPMWGSIDVIASDARAVVSVALDGQALGYVPVHLDSVAPGPHELRFTGAGTDAWGTTIEVRVGETREVLAYPLQSPATGLLQVRATQSAAGASAPLDGAHVWVDGVARGVTPLTLELARGPHSVRVAYQKEEAPIQVIELPGGNQRFATFEFGLRPDLPTLVLKAPASFGVDEPALISATLNDLAAADVREMWLHVRTPDNRWRRYAMTLLDAQGSVVGAAPFPVALIGEDGQQLYYVSALTAQGDELFTEMQTARGAARSRR